MINVLNSGLPRVIYIIFHFFFKGKYFVKMSGKVVIMKHVVIAVHSSSLTTLMHIPILVD